MYDPHVPYTGAGVRGRHFVNVLARHFLVDLVYMAGAGQPSRDDLEMKYKDSVRGVQEERRIPFSQKGYFIYSHALYRAAAGLMGQKTYDFIVADYGLAARYALRLQRRFRVPFVYCSHNIEYRQYRGKAKSDWRRWPLVPYMHRVEKCGCRKSAVLVAVSDSDAQMYARWTSPRKIIVIPQGFDETVFHPFYRPAVNDPKIVLFFGNYRISTNRDAVYAVRDTIADNVISRFPRVIFQFIGDHPPRELSSPHMEFLGFVEDLAGAIRRCDAVISPIQAGWGMPTKIIESLACGKPVVATETAARSVPASGRLHVVPLEHFAETIVRVLKEARPVDADGFDALKKQFGWEVQIMKLVERLRRFPADAVQE